MHRYAVHIPVDPMEDFHDVFKAEDVLERFQDNVSPGEFGYYLDVDGGSLPTAWMTVREEEKGAISGLLLTKEPDPTKNFIFLAVVKCVG